LKNLYRIDIEQWKLINMLTGKKWDRIQHETYDVISGTLESAIKKARSAANKDGFLKSRPLEIVKAERIAANIL
jgi:hypothetical protein